jgi:hypothetical protein
MAQSDRAAVPRATVHLEALGPFGAMIPKAHVHLHLFSSDRKLDFGPGDDSTISGVPYGEYIASAWDDGGGQTEREVVVNTKEVWIRIGLRFPAGDRLWPGGDLTIGGAIAPVPPADDGDWGVRVDGLFLHVSKEAPVLRSGQFSVGGLEMGTYLVEVFEGSKLRHIETIEIDPNRPNTFLHISVTKTTKGNNAVAPSRH